MATKQQPTVRIRLTNKERMAVYAVLVKNEEESEEAAPWQLRGDAQSKTYSELCIMVRPHLRLVIRDQYTGENLEALVESNKKEAAKVCRSDGGEYDAADEEQVAHWKNVDATTRSLQADVRTASESTREKLRANTLKATKKRNTEQGKKQDLYNNRKKKAKKEARRARSWTLRHQ